MEQKADYTFSGLKMIYINLRESKIHSLKEYQKIQELKFSGAQICKNHQGLKKNSLCTIPSHKLFDGFLAMNDIFSAGQKTCLPKKYTNYE